MTARSSGSLLSYLLAVFAVGLAIGGLAGYTAAKRSPDPLPSREQFEESWVAKYQARLGLSEEQVAALRPMVSNAVQRLAGTWYRAVMTMGAIQQSVDRKLEPLLNEQQRAKLVALVKEARRKRLEIAGERFDKHTGVQDHIWYAAAVGDRQAIERHLERGVEVDQQDIAFGMTPLAVAAMHGQPDAVDLLLEKGADVNLRMSDGNTALHAAAFFGRVECVKRLLAHGADPLLRNGEGKTPLEAMQADWGTIQFIADILQVELDKQKTLAGREAVAEILRAAEAQRRTSGSGRSQVSSHAAKAPQEEAQP